jgi:hypothetical protein
MKKWFSVETFFEGINLSMTNVASLWEQSIILVEAENNEIAKTNAKKIAIKNEHEYQAIDGSDMKWKFRDLGNVFEVDSESLMNGIEIFSRFLRESEVKSLLTPFKE